MHFHPSHAHPESSDIYGNDIFGVPDFMGIRFKGIRLNPLRIGRTWQSAKNAHDRPQKGGSIIVGLLYVFVDLYVSLHPKVLGPRRVDPRLTDQGRID